MKKLLVVLLGALLVLSGCSGSSAKTYKVGFASITEVTSTNAAVETADSDAKSGQVQADTYYALVLLESDKIVDVMIDVAQNSVKYDAAGALVDFDADAATPTKKEKADAYGMKKNSDIGKEWYEQIAALETNMVGKTITEVSAIDLESDADLASSVSITIDTYKELVKKAADAAVEVKGVKTIGSASNTSITAAAASADKDGSIQFDTYLSGTALDADGKIIYVYNDVAQNTATFTTDGVATLTSKDTTNFPSKVELGDNYGMKINSDIGKDWYEQQEALETYMTGKTIAEVEGIELADGKAADADLVSQVSISISGYIAVVAKSQSAGYTRTIA